MIEVHGQKLSQKMLYWKTLEIWLASWYNEEKSDKKV